MSSFRQSYPKDRIAVTFDTDYRSSGNVSSPVFTLNETVKRVGKISVDKIIFPCSYFVFNNGNNILTPNINGTAITITPGIYTEASLAAAIQTEIRNTGGGFSAATCVFANNRFTISSGSVSTFTLSASGQLAKILGFTSDKTSVTNATSDFLIYEKKFVMSSSNRSFIINQASTDYTFNITPGNYSGVSLAIEMQSLIVLQLAGFVVSYNYNNYTFVITGNASFTFKATGTASLMLGFDVNVASASNIVVSPLPVNIIGPTSIIIKSRAISNVRQLVVRTSDIYNDAIYELLLNGGNGEVIYDNPDDPSEIYIATSGGASFTSLDFRIIDDSGKLLDLGVNGRWKIFLVFETY